MRPLVPSIAVLAITACGSNMSTPDASPPVLGPRVHWGTPTKVVEGTTAFGARQPTLTEDQLALWYVAPSAVGQSIYAATRAMRTDPWSAPIEVTELGLRSFSPSVAADGLAMWLTSNPDGSIMIARRADRSRPWDAPAPAAGLAGVAASGLSLDPTATTIALGVRDTPDAFHVALATRPDAASPWALSPTLPVALVNGQAFVEPALSGDLLELYYAVYDAGDPNAPDAYHVAVVRRASVDQPFGAPEVLDELASLGSVRSPWVSRDGHTLYVSAGTPRTPHSLYALTR